jgi:hypothetical protein
MSNTKATQVNFLSVGIHVNAVFPGNFTECSHQIKHLTLIWNWDAQGRNATPNVFLQVNKADGTFCCIVRQSVCHKRKVFLVVFHGIFFTEKNRIVPQTTHSFPISEDSF